MKKRVFAALMLVVMLLGILAGCGGKNDPLTDEEAKKIVTEYAVKDGDKVGDIHSHIGETEDGQVCFNVYITINGKSYTYQVHAVTGEILSVTEGGHSH